MSDPAWPEVKAKASDVLDRASKALKTHGADLVVTEYQRGRLAAMEEILALEHMRKEIPRVTVDV